MQTYVTVYLTAEAAYAGLTDHTEQLWLSGMLVAQEANARFIVDAHKAWVRCRERSASLRSKKRKMNVYKTEDRTTDLLTQKNKTVMSICYKEGDR